tara:strand:+ start:432 stop:620 length:189 start_codon:yes stop_codon:yes gene_type:complete
MVEVLDELPSYQTEDGYVFYQRSDGKMTLESDGSDSGLLMFDSLEDLMSCVDVWIIDQLVEV